MARDRDGYEKIKYVGKENIREDIWTCGRKGIWRLRTDQELQEMYRDLDIVADITKKSLEWMRHIVRLDNGRLIKKIFESKLKRRKEWEDQE